MFKLARELSTSKDVYTVCIKDLVINFPEDFVPANDSKIFNIVRLDIWRGKEFKSMTQIDNTGLVTASRK
jgi:hypothetical protein